MSVLEEARAWVRGIFGRSAEQRPARLRTVVSTERTLRIFVSSTFRDMTVAREVLRRDVFPAVRRACEDRGVTLLEIDLRWGVTREEAEAGEVLGICLDEIDRCRPYFLGLLGHRYGWVDPNAAGTLSREVYRNLLPFADRSVTELEVRHGIVNRPANAPAPVPLVYALPPDPAAGGHPFAALISDLDAASVRVRPMPEAPDRLAADIRRDLLALVEERFPRAEDESGPDRSLAQALEVAEALRTRYAGRAAAEAVLQQIRSGTGRIALLGPAGSGKTSILAEVVRRIHAAGERRVVSVLSPVERRTWADAATAALQQLGKQIDGLPPTTARLARDLGQAIAASSKLSPTVVVLDGIAEEDLDFAEANGPGWLPSETPGATVVLSLPGGAETGRALHRHGFQTVLVDRLPADEARQVVEHHLSAFGKALSATQQERVLSRHWLPEDLAVVLEELRQVPAFEQIDEALHDLMDRAEHQRLYDGVAARVAREIPATMSFALVALAVTEHGLTESGLALVAGDPESPAPQLHVQLLRGSLGYHLFEQGGRIRLRRRGLATAILKGATAAGQNEAAVRHRLATMSLSDPGIPGAAEEGLAQFLALERWDALKAALEDARVAEPLLRRSPQDFAAFWQAVSLRTGATAAGSLIGWLGVEPVQRLGLAAAFLIDIGEQDAAYALASEALRTADPQDASTLARALTTLATCAEMRGELDDATAHLTSLAALAIQVEDRSLQATACINLARLAYLRGGAGAYERTRAEASRALDQAPTARSEAALLTLDGLSAVESGRPRVAQQAFERARGLARLAGDLRSYAACGAGLARVALARGSLPAAAQHLAEARLAAETLGERRLLLEVAAAESEWALDAGNGSAFLSLVQERRRLAQEVGDVLSALEIDLDEAIFLARNRTTELLARSIALRTRARAAELGLERLQRRIGQLLES